MFRANGEPSRFEANRSRCRTPRAANPALRSGSRQERQAICSSAPLRTGLNFVAEATEIRRNLRQGQEQSGNGAAASETCRANALRDRPGPFLSMPWASVLIGLKEEDPTQRKKRPEHQRRSTPG